MKAKKILALVLTLCMVVSLFPVAFAAEKADALSIADATVTKLAPTVDGKKVNVTWYADGYLSQSNSDKQKVNVYVPENATEESPIMLYVNNSGWMQNNYPTDTIEDGKDYDGTNDRVGVALKEGYVVVSYGCRSRTDPTIGHSPATMTDTKAVIRWLRYNDDAIIGDAEKIVVTGTSGGGALSVIISASGNSADYYESLFEVGAAGIVKNPDGSYTSSINDDVWATIAYCPITDLGNACAAYDWTWGEARTKLMADGSLSYKGASAEQVNANAAALTAIYEEYLDSLGLESVSAANLEATIIDLMEAEIAESIEEFGIDQMKKDLGEATWLTFNEDGTFTYDYDAHTLWVAQQTALKISPAFSNVGTGYGEFMNEDNLFGAPEDVYSPFNEYSWSIDATENAVGEDDTGLTWDEYMATEDGERLALQIKMTNPIPYLLDAEDGDSAPYWYVRYGMADRDSSFAVEAVLNAAMEADDSIKEKTFEFAWLKPHSGNYDVPEAYAWLADKLDEYGVGDAEVTELNITLDGKATTVTQYVDLYYPEAQAADQIVTVYVPQNATKASPVIYMVNNGGWFMNQADKAYKVAEGGKYVSDSDTDAVGKALAEGYVIMSAGSRNRNMAEIGHSPATMVDYKAAIRWFNHNADAIGAGDPDKIIATGTSGGGALSTVLAASGNSSDYLPYLYEAGAYGVDYVDGKYVDTSSDAVLGVIAYCPITDLGHACAAYEWQYNATREAMYESGHMDYGTLDEKTNMAASAELKAVYEEYLATLGVDAVKAENLEATIIALMEAEIAEAIEEVGVEQMKKDMAATEYAGTWITFNEDGSFDYDYEEHLYWLARKQTLKPASAFSNVGMAAWAGQMNEDNLFGDASDVYCPFNPYSWANDTTDNAVGKDDTGLTWEGFLATEKGKMVQLQARMTSAVAYLYDAEDDADVAPYWYVRHGMADRDTAFAVEAVLFEGIKNDADILNYNYEFAWLEAHGGNYDVQEAYAWLKTIVDPTVKVSSQKITVAGEPVDAEIYNINGNNYFKLRDIAMLLKGSEAEFGVDFDNAKKEVYIETGDKYEAVGGELDKAGDKSASCVLSDFVIIVDGEAVAVQVYNIGGSNYFKLRDLGDAVGFAVDYDAASRTIKIL